jgi:hypothetical protein
MKLKLTSRSFLYIALLAILIIVFCYGVKFIGTLTEGYNGPVFSGKKCGTGGMHNTVSNCSKYCRNIKDSNGNNKFETGKCNRGNCMCQTSK